MSVSIPTYKDSTGLIITYLTPEELDLVSSSLSVHNKRVQAKRASLKKKSSGRPTKPLLSFAPPKTPTRSDLASFFAPFAQDLKNILTPSQ
jgi:hypothetical protein